MRFAICYLRLKRTAKNVLVFGRVKRFNKLPSPIFLWMDVVKISRDTQVLLAKILHNPADRGKERLYLCSYLSKI